MDDDGLAPQVNTMDDEGLAPQVNTMDDEGLAPQVNTMDDEGLAPQVNKSSAATILTRWDIKIIVFPKKGFQQPVPFQCGEMISNQNKSL